MAAGGAFALGRLQKDSKMARMLRTQSGRAPTMAGPVNVAVPTRSGTATLGQVQTCTPGTWSGYPPPALTYRWIRDASTVIAGATGLTYTIVAADQTHTVKVEETATNERGSAVAFSLPTGTIP
jgi:hypothetical protein